MVGDNLIVIVVAIAPLSEFIKIIEGYDPVGTCHLNLVD
jgi:hypothetical protein